MGSIDPPPQPLAVAPQPEPPKPILPPAPTLGLPGVLGIFVGFLFFVAGVLSSLNILTMGIGIAFMAAGSSAKVKPPRKLCPACRFEIPREASVCGFCHLEQPA